MKENHPWYSVVSLSGVYEEYPFDEKEAEKIDCRDLPGTNCYCDDEARRILLQRLPRLSESRFHLLDSGNYHYLSALWISRIQEPFRLIVFDNHTDMQPPAFGGLLSCGGWLAASIEENLFLEDVILIGPDEDSFLQTDELFRKKVRFISKEALSDVRMHAEDPDKSLITLLDHAMEAQDHKKNPVYISIDKDILSSEEMFTTWSQGDLTVSELLLMTEHILDTLQKEKTALLGADICGEPDPDQSLWIPKSREINQRLLALFHERE